MPIFLEPDQTFEVCLDADQSKPIETRPVFVCLSQSMRGQRSILHAVDLLDENHSVNEIFNATLAELVRVVVGWRNIDKPFFAGIHSLIVRHLNKQLPCLSVCQKVVKLVSKKRLVNVSPSNNNPHQLSERCVENLIY